MDAAEKPGNTHTYMEKKKAKEKKRKPYKRNDNGIKPSPLQPRSQ